MQYLCLIYADEEIQSGMDEAARGQYFQGYMQFTEGIKASGNYLGGEALTPVSTATSVRVRGGQTVITDGPFAETKEQLGGFYLIEAADLDEATSIAARIPTAAHGTIEVRPIMVWD